VLTTDSLFAELICDGIHNTPEMVKIWWRCKGSGARHSDHRRHERRRYARRRYQLGGLTVQVADGRASLGDVLAGSVLTLDRALTNFLAFTGASVEEGLRLLTANPAAMTGSATQPVR
jgi:N-acetylglucosamine-6-phosphate deacetylase